MYKSIWFGFLFYYNWTPFLSNLLPSFDGCVKRFLVYEISRKSGEMFLCCVIQSDHNHRTRTNHRSFTDPNKKCRRMGRPGWMLQQESSTTLWGNTPNHLPNLGLESGVNRFWSLPPHLIPSTCSQSWETVPNEDSKSLL